MEKTKKIPSKTVKKCKKKTIIIFSVAAFLILATALTLALTLGWFNPTNNFDGVTKIGYGETNKKDFWEASYNYLDGSIKKEFKADGDERTLTLEFETVTGEIGFIVYDKQTELAVDYVYHENVGNGYFEIPFTDTVVLRLDAKEHEGRFSIKAE